MYPSLGTPDLTYSR